MNYFIFAALTALTITSYTVFQKNNTLATENNNAVEVAKTIQTLASITNIENISGNKNVKSDVLNMSNYIVNPKDKTSKNTTLYNKLHRAMQKALETDDEPTCTDLSKTKIISLSECNYISSQNFDLYDLEDSEVSIDSTNQNQPYLKKATAILSKNDFASTSENTKNTFATPKTSSYKIKQTKLNIKQSNEVSAKIKRILAQDDSGDTAVFISKMAQQRNYPTKNNMSELSIKRLAVIEKKKNIKAQNEALKEAQATGEDFNEILNSKLSGIKNKSKTNKESIIEDVASSGAKTSNDMLVIAEKSTDTTSINKIKSSTKEIVYKVTGDSAKEHREKIKISEELITAYESEIKNIDTQMESLQADNTVFGRLSNHDKILKLKSKRMEANEKKSRETKKRNTYKSQL